MHSTNERAAAYLERMPPAISGSGGHSAAFNAAVVLTRGFAMPEADALPLLLAWNLTHCLPPWSEAELRHKLRSAGTSTRPLGYLLNEPTPRPNAAPDFESEAERKARQRQGWPPFLPLKPAGLEAVARLRKLPLSAVKLAARAGFLSGGIVEGQSCFILHEGTFAQARRLDGQPFTLADGRQVKAKNLPGSERVFMGTRWLGGPTMKVLLVEGCVSLVEALAAHELNDPAHGWTILAATSASSRFSRAPEILAALAGRFVRIIPDADEAGQDAAAAWLADLDNAGACVEALSLPLGIKDLGPLVAEPAAHAETLNALFQ